MGDPKYGVPARGVHRPLLHAARVVFVHPRTREPVVIEAPVPWTEERAAPARAGVRAEGQRDVTRPRGRVTRLAMTVPAASLSSFSVPALLARLDAELAAEPRRRGRDGRRRYALGGRRGGGAFSALLGAGGVRDAAREALVEEARAVGVAVPTLGDATAVARALYEAHLAGAYPNDRAFATMAWAFAGFTRDEVRALGERVLDARGFEGKLRPALRAVLAWAGERGAPVYVVSASPVESCSPRRRGSGSRATAWRR